MTHPAPTGNQRLLELFEDLWDNYVDRREAYAGDDGEWWLPLGGELPTTAAPECLAELRAQCRRLAVENEFAINGHENRISYIVGPGHRYLAAVRKRSAGTDGLAGRVQDVIDEFVCDNGWVSRQQEIVRRLDRDGECFLRLFADRQGRVQVRSIEPEQVATPTSSTSERTTHGIVCRTGDAEAPEAYWVDGALLAAEHVQHRKANVDRNVRRGLPLYTPVRKNLRRAEKLLRNMSAVAEVQSAIALIRKHRGASRSGVEAFVADSSTERVRAGRPERISQYGPGTILDAPAGLEYDFPAARIEAASFVTVLQAELRAIAARLVMPEFMFTSDASNASYASTMMAEGPAVRMFERLQSSLMEDDLALLWRVMELAMRAGRLPADTRSLIEIQVTPPTLVARHALDEARVCDIAFRRGILSPQSWSRKLGLDYHQEQTNRGQHDRCHADGP